MKAQKVTVYTIGFEVDDPRALTELAQCASGAAAFFDAKDGASLKTAFKKIGEQISALRFTK